MKTTISSYISAKDKDIFDGCTVYWYGTGFCSEISNARLYKNTKDAAQTIKQIKREKYKVEDLKLHIQRAKK